MPTVPVRGQAVQAPMETAPKAAPRDSDSQVVPRPTAAATAKANTVPKKNRTGQIQMASGMKIRNYQEGSIALRAGVRRARAGGGKRAGRLRAGRARTADRGN